MKILFYAQDWFAEFVNGYYAADPRLCRADFRTQLEARYQTLYFLSDFYSRNLAKLGHDATSLFYSNQPLQLAWAGENLDPKRYQRRVFQRLLGAIPYRVTTEPIANWDDEIMLAQVERFEPDVLLLYHIHAYSTALLRRLKSHCGKLVGQLASRFLPDIDYGLYDLFLSSLPNLVSWFEETHGVPSRLLRLGFETSVLDQVPPRERTHDVVFIGQISGDHGRRERFLTRLARTGRLEFWGTGVELLPCGSPLRDCFRGPAYGRKAYEILAASKIGFNGHLDVAESHANNMRLYETTGMGAMLLTDHQVDIGEIFDVGREVVTYRDEDELAAQVDYYLSHDDEREEIARAGQARCLREHTYERRVRELSEVLEGL